MSIRIYSSEASDPVITGTVEELILVAAATRYFLNSSDNHLSITANTTGSPKPYSSFLPSIEFDKNHGAIHVSRSPQGGLYIAGSTDNLQIWCNHFAFPLDASYGDHHHPEQVHRPNYVTPASISVVIEVRDDD